MIGGHPFEPIVDNRLTNCGPTVLAGLLGISTGSAITLMKLHYPKGWKRYTNIGHIRAVLEAKNIKMKKVPAVDIETDPDIPYLFFLQIEGPWVAKGWMSAYSHTHWMLLHKEHILDVNNIGWYQDVTKVKWVDYDTWSIHIMPGLVEDDKGTDWSTRGCYKITEEQQRRLEQ